MLALVLVQAGLPPSFIIGGEVNEIGGGAAWDDGELVRRRGRRERRHVPRAARRGRRRHQRRARPPRALRRLRRSRRRLRPVPRPGAGPARGVRRRPGRGRAWPRRAARSPTATSDGRRLPHGRPARRTRRGRASPSSTAGASSARIRLPVPGLHNAAQRRRRARRPRCVLGAPFAAASQRAGALRRRRPPLRVRGERAASRSSTTTRTSRRGRAPRSARHATGGWRRVVCVFQPHRYSRTASLWRDFGDAFDARRPARGDRRVPGRRDAAPGVSGRLVVEAVLDAPPGGVAWLPAPRRRRPATSRRLRPGDLCLTLGAGDLTSVPDELPSAGRRDGRRRGRAAAARPGRRVRARRAARAADDLSRRRAGARCSSWSTTTTTSRRSPRAVRADGVAGARGRRGSNLLVADAGFDGLAVVAGRRRSPTVEVDGARRSRAAAAGGAARRSPAAPRPPGSPGFEWAVGVPGSVGGAVRMNAGGHGSDMAARSLRVRVVDLATGEDGWMAPATSTSGTGARRSARPGRGCAAELALAG